MLVDHISVVLVEMIKAHASDVYLTFGCPPALRVEDAVHYIGSDPLGDEDIGNFIQQMLTPEQHEEFRSTLELNIALNFDRHARFRVNLFRQQAHDGVVIRRIETNIPTPSSLGLPAIYGELAMKKRGLILLSGQTGSGKSTSLASMVGHRNAHGSGHIITVEDPIEFVHEHNKCIITQRDVGIDTYAYALALKNALRQRPDMVVIGEVRDREVMEQAIYFAESGHLCVATIHANNAGQTIERVLNFFPEERHPQILLNLSLNLHACLSQRLVQTIEGKRTLALEIMLNRGLIRQHIEQGKVRLLREMIERGGSEGMHTFDQHLYKLCEKGIISEEVALAESDSPANLRLLFQNKHTSERIAGITLRNEHGNSKTSDF